MFFVAMVSRPPWGIASRLLIARFRRTSSNWVASINTAQRLLSSTISTRTAASIVWSSRSPILEKLIQNDHSGCQVLPTGKGEELSGKLCTALGRGARASQKVKELLVLRSERGEFDVADDRRQQIIEIMRHPRRQSPNGFHL